MTVRDSKMGTAATLRELANRNTTALIGASLLSAAGSLPLHLMPLIVVSLVADSRTSIAQAGWVATAVLLGQLSTSLALPALAVRTVKRGPSLAVALALLAALMASGLDGATILFTGWFLVGGCCGVLQYLGIVTASNDPSPTFAFTLRLSIVLMIAGAVVVALQAADVLASYLSMLTALAAILGLVLATGLPLYHPQTGNLRPESHKKAGGQPLGAVGGLATVFLLFVGQTGFLAYAIQSAIERGIATEEAAWALAAMKIVTGAWLLSIARTGLKSARRPRFLGLGLLLGFSVFLISYTGHWVGFIVGLIAYEIAFNTLAARLQGQVALAAPQSAGRWLTAAILLGAASGPPLHGAAISADAGAYFIGFAALSALLPSLWAKALPERPQ
jgi:MFS family permease